MISFKIDKKDNVYIIRMSGAITADTLPEYRHTVEDMMKDLDVENRENLNFIVDYQGITDVDSTAVANVVDRLKNAVRDDHKVVFINVPEKFQSLVEVLKVEDAIQIFPSEDEAMAYLSS